MSQAEIELTVETRDRVGKNHNRRLRASGRVPAVVYGGGRDPVAIQVERKTVHDLLKAGGGEHAIFLLKLAGTDKSRHAMIRHLEVDPIKRQILHIDFQRVLLTEKLKVAVQVELVGTPVGVKTEGGLVEFITREVEVECLPADIPGRLELDISELHMGQHLEVRHLVLPAGVALVSEPERVVVSISHPRVAEAVEAAMPELIEAEKTEPEVIRRGKVVTEGEES